MCEIIFRGKEKNTKKWVHGGYASKSETTYAFAEDYEKKPVETKHYIVADEMTDWGLPNKLVCYEVIPETIGTDFVLLRGQRPLKNYRDAWTHKYEHMDKFRQSDAIIVCDPNGSIGIGTMFEFGFMVAIAKRIIFTEAPKNWTIPFPYEIGLNFYD